MFINVFMNRSVKFENHHWKLHKKKNILSEELNLHFIKSHRMFNCNEEMKNFFFFFLVFLKIIEIYGGKKYLLLKFF